MNSGGLTLRQNVTHDLRAVIEKLTREQLAIAELYLFGSRAYGTMSTRSDCDIIVRAASNARIRGSDLREFASSHCAPLDLFLCTEARATSVTNDSFVQAASFHSLIEKLDAQLLWSRNDGFAEFAFGASNDWTFEVSSMVDFVPSVLPDSALGEAAWQYMQQKVEVLGLPTRPYIGDSLVKASAELVRIARGMVMKPRDLGPKGLAKKGWTVDLQSEYDCQNLFYTVVKPWLPALGREEVAIVFDGQEKKSDFSLFECGLIIEMKFIDSLGKKREVVKTLDGLARFYARNANVRGLLFIIYVKKDIEIDDPRWEQDYSTMGTSPWVSTVVIRIP
jgi:predicted nucleotidyltransferase